MAPLPNNFCCCKQNRAKCLRSCATLVSLPRCAGALHHLEPSVTPACGAHIPWSPQPPSRAPAAVLVSCAPSPGSAHKHPHSTQAASEHNTSAMRWEGLKQFAAAAAAQASKTIKHGCGPGETHAAILNRSGGAPTGRTLQSWLDAYLALLHHIVRVGTREASGLQQIHHLRLAAQHRHGFTRQPHHQGPQETCCPFLLHNSSRGCAVS